MAQMSGNITILQDSRDSLYALYNIILVYNIVLILYYFYGI